jgi:hypothetical protein
MLGCSPRIAPLVPVAAVALVLLLVQAAQAAPPPNDNYLSSTRIGSVGRGSPSDPPPLRVDTSEATTQQDLFDPDREGLPLGGGGPETTRCGGASFGKTVWYDFFPRFDGDVLLTASGFAAVIGLSKWDPATSRITGRVKCARREVGPVSVDGGSFYTVQVGGAITGGVAASGMLELRFQFLADRDGDRVYDVNDDCDERPGIGGSGCPPQLDPSFTLLGDYLDNGVRLTSLEVSDVPRGTRVEARCRRCGLAQVLTRRGKARALLLTRFVGRALPNGSALELFVTRGKSRRGRYRFGAVGRYRCYRVRGSRLARPLKRNLEPGSRRPKRRC